MIPRTCCNCRDGLYVHPLARQGEFPPMCLLRPTDTRLVYT
jgi:hypothetical protein